MSDRQIWLKAIGTGNDPLPDEWLIERPDLLNAVHFVNKPSGIERNDLLLYYASGKQRVFAVARAKEPGADATLAGTADQKHWPYRLDVQVLIATPTLPLAAKYDVLEKQPEAMSQKSHILLTSTEYQRYLDWLMSRIDA